MIDQSKITLLRMFLSNVRRREIKQKRFIVADRFDAIEKALRQYEILLSYVTGAYASHMLETYFQEDDEALKHWNPPEGWLDALANLAEIDPKGAALSRKDRWLKMIDNAYRNISREEIA